MNKIGGALLAGQCCRCRAGCQEYLVLFLDHSLYRKSDSRVRNVEYYVDGVAVEPLPGYGYGPNVQTMPLPSPRQMPIRSAMHGRAQVPDSSASATVGRISRSMAE